MNQVRNMRGVRVLWGEEVDVLIGVWRGRNMEGRVVGGVGLHRVESEVDWSWYDFVAM